MPLILTIKFTIFTTVTTLIQQTKTIGVTRGLTMNNKAVNATATQEVHLVGTLQITPVKD